MNTIIKEYTYKEEIMDGNYQGGTFMTILAITSHIFGQIQYSEFVSVLANTLAVIAGIMAIINYLMKWSKDYHQMIKERKELKNKIKNKYP